MRSWFTENQPGESYVPLIDEEQAESSMGLPVSKKHSPGAWNFYRGWHAKDTARRVFWVMMPSFLARALGHADDDSVIPAASETSYLNGLRGVASLIVALQHTIDADYPLIHHAWGDGDENHSLLQLPLVRIVHSGIFMVCIFFIISGFALTYSPLKKSHAGQGAAAVSSLPSSVFRRPFRLFIPLIPVLAVSTLLVYFHAFYKLFENTPMQPVATGLWGHIYYVYSSLHMIITSGTNDTVMPQGWTLSAEYQGSLLVFLCCMAFAQAHALVRISFVFSLLIFYFNQGAWPQCLFLTGMLLADVRHGRERLPSLPGPARMVVTVALCILLIIGLFLGGWPALGNGWAGAGWSSLTWLSTFGVHPLRYFTSVGAVAVLVALENLPALQRGFNTRLALYLGEVSYSVYLVHWVAGKCFLTAGLKYWMTYTGGLLT
ncbi:putative acyltransferase [Colletotrichum sublineola]|uniref:Putative acyltransferase n=1 Tax=Colletotrichum sublineola TaxID=1173701 RepID=A0A066XTM3_COLSU|nr:putative acyltransferase [Colletotrichum sublineola]